MPKIVDAEVQRQEIRDAARAVFARRGVRGTGLAHVAEAAGMGRSSLYHYYPDKETLLADLVAEVFDAERRMFRDTLRGEGTPLDRVERLTRGCAALFPEWAAFGRLILDLRLGDVKTLKAGLRDMRRELARVLAEGRDDGTMRGDLDPALAASILIGAIDGLLLQYFADPRALPDPDALADELWATARRLVT